MTKLPLPGLVDLSFVTVQYPAQEARKTGLIDEVAVKVTKGKTPRQTAPMGRFLGGLILRFILRRTPYGRPTSSIFQGE